MQQELQHRPQPSHSSPKPLIFFAACTPHFIPTSFISYFLRFICLNKDDTSPKPLDISMHIMLGMASTPTIIYNLKLKDGFCHFMPMF
jgi:hypothetical protein